MMGYESNRIWLNPKMLSSECYCALNVTLEEGKHSHCQAKEKMQGKGEGCFGKETERHTLRTIKDDNMLNSSS